MPRALSPNHLSVTTFHQSVYLVHFSSFFRSSSQTSIPPSESSFTGCQALVSLATNLGQCTPYHVLPTRGDTVLATNTPGKPALEIDYSTEILDRLGGPKEMTEVCLLYRYPPCAGDSYALVVYVKPSQAVLEAEIPVCVVLALWCYSWIVPFAVFWVFFLVCWLVRLVRRIVLVALGLPYRLLKGLPVALAMFAVNVCVQLYINMLVESNNNIRDVEDAPLFDNISPAASILLLPEPVDPTDSPSLEDEVATTPDAAEQDPAALAGPSSHAVDAPVIDTASVPVPEDSEDEGVLSSSVQAPSSPVAGPSYGSAEEDQGEGEWTMVVKRKPWRPFAPVPKTGANSSSKGGGREGGQEGMGKGSREGRHRGVLW
ncbi:hypothetical protein RhiJN_18073 [Ceratobasidium sp. AG-Ba]|nr:hypothetical protein RhiJN_18073 [Ceratobasidium sp. AG-Ba]